MIGSNTLAIKNPPIMKKIVATRLGSCRFAIPMMEWPLVQPPAYRVPKPTRNPPPTIMIMPRSVNSDSQFISWVGTKLLKSVIP